MKIWINPTVPLLTAIALLALAAGPTHAHSFKVALVVPPSKTVSIRDRQIIKGFMLATTERDSHPDQESDGHLGGLDVYVSVIEETEDAVDQINRVAAQGDVDIVAVLGAETAQSLNGKRVDERGVAVLLPGQSPFRRTDLPAVAAFISAFEQAYGAKPTEEAARGYNAARRIDTAVRAQGGVDDKLELRRSFRNTARNFTW